MVMTGRIGGDGRAGVIHRMRTNDGLQAVGAVNQLLIPVGGMHHVLAQPAGGRKIEGDPERIFGSLEKGRLIPPGKEGGSDLGTGTGVKNMTGAGALALKSGPHARDSV